MVSVASLVPIRDYPEETKIIAGRKEKVGSLKADDVKQFVVQLEHLVHPQQSPVIHDIIARNAPLILDVIRIVNLETKQGFKGMAARAGELEINWVRPGTFGKTTWLTSYTSTGSNTWFSETRLLEYEALIILGWIDPIEVPKIDAIYITKDGDPLPAQTMPWMAKNNFGTYQTPIVEQKLPLVVLPEHKFKIEVNVFATGDDKLEPIGFHIRRAEDFMSATAPRLGTA